MTAVRYHVYARNLARQNMGEIPDYSDLRIEDRFNDIGGWVLSAPIGSRADTLLDETGGIIVTRDFLDGNGPSVVFSGPVTDIVPDATTVTISGVSDDVILAEKLGSPDPTTDTSPWTTEQNLRQGIASSVMIDYVRYNAVVGAAAGGRGVTGLTTVTDPGVGLYVYGQARWISLLALMQDLALKGGLSLPAKSLGFRILQSSTASATVEFSVYAPTNRSDTVVISKSRGTLGNWTKRFSRPGLTRVYVLGQGQGIDRQVVDRRDTTLATKYGYEIEGIVDRRDTNDVLTLQQSGDAALASSGELITVSYTAVDIPSLVWGKDYNKGDVVTVKTEDGVSTVQVVRGVNLSLTTPNGGGSDRTAEVQPIISTPGDTSDDPADRQQRQVARDVNALQRNVDSLLAAIANQWDIGNIRSTARTVASAGWLLCRGQAVNRVTYAALFGVIGSTFGAGDGSTTFNVPDARDRVLIGAGSTYALGDTGGATTASIIDHAHGVGTLAGSSHTHGAGTYADTGHTHGVGTYAYPNHSHSAGTLAGPSHGHAPGTFIAPNHSHSAGTIAIPNHLHGNGTLVAPNHGHAAGSVAIPNHSHAVGSLAGSSHTHAAGTYAVSISLTSGPPSATGTAGGGGGSNIPTDTHTHTLSSSPGVSGSSGGSSVTITGATATDGGSGLTTGNTNGQGDQALGGAHATDGGSGLTTGNTNGQGDQAVTGTSANAGNGSVTGSTASDAGTSISGTSASGTAALTGSSGGTAVTVTGSTGAAGAVVVSVVQPYVAVNYEIYTSV